MAEFHLGVICCNKEGPVLAQFFLGVIYCDKETDLGIHFFTYGSDIICVIDMIGISIYFLTNEHGFL